MRLRRHLDSKVFLFTRRSFSKVSAKERFALKGHMRCISRAAPSAESKRSISGVVLVDVAGRGRILPRELVFERLIEASRDL